MERRRNHSEINEIKCSFFFFGIGSRKLSFNMIAPLLFPPPQLRFVFKEKRHPSCFIVSDVVGFNSEADVTQQSSPLRKRKALPGFTQRYLPGISEKEGVPDSFLSSSPPHPNLFKGTPEPGLYSTSKPRSVRFALAPQRVKSPAKHNKRKEETEQAGQQPRYI